MVSYLGARFQYDNWLKQEEISRQKTHQEKLFDKRAEIVEKSFSLFAKRTQNAYNMLSACLFLEERDRLKYCEICQEIMIENTALEQQILIYFDLVTRAKIRKPWDQIIKIWQDVELQLCKYPECKSVTKELLDQKLEVTNKNIREIRKIFSKKVYSKEWGLNK